VALTAGKGVLVVSHAATMWILPTRAPSGAQFPQHVQRQFQFSRRI
jgi:hypothetical protein